MQTPDPATARGKAEFAAEREETELRTLKAEAGEAETAEKTAWWDLKYRIFFGPALLIIAVFWLYFVRGVVNRQGYSAGAAATRPASQVEFFKLSDGVMIALLTTTTATVLGLVAAVVAYLFWRRTQPSGGTKP